MAPMIFTYSLASLSLLLLLPVLTPCRGLVPSGTRRAVCGSLLSGVYASDGHRSAAAHRRPPSAPNPGFHLPARSAAPALPAGWGDVLGAAERAGRWNPRFGATGAISRHASAEREMARRVDRGRKSRPHHSAELRSMRDQPLRASPGLPPPPPPAPISLSAMGGRRPPTFVSPAMPPTGWLGGVRIRQRTDLRR